MSGIIVYQSNYGSTRQYAEWIHESTGFPLFDSADRAIPWNVDTVIIGCPVIAFKPVLLGWMQRHWCNLRGKRVVLFTTSGADPAVVPVKDWVSKALPSDIQSQVEVFPLAGRFNFATLSGKHKMMLRIAAVVLRSEDIKNQMKHAVDRVHRENLDPLLEYVMSKTA